MKRFVSLLAATVVIGASFSAAGAGSPTWDKYWNRVQFERDDWYKQYQKWFEQNREGYRKYPQNVDVPKGFQFDLDDLNIPAGKYSLQLPSGLKFRVDVNNPNTPIKENYWPASVYQNVYYYASRLHGDLRDVQFDLSRNADAGLQSLATKALQDSSQFLSVVSSPHPVPEVLAKYQDFDQSLHRLTHRLEQTSNLPYVTRARLNTIKQSDLNLHQTLKISRQPAYDRLRVAALAQQLVQTTKHLYEDVDLESRKDPQLAYMVRLADRVKDHARDFFVTVQQNGSYPLVRQEYQQFDESWHRLLNQIRYSPRSEDHLRDIARKVWQVDSALHQALLIDSPVVFDRQRLAQLTSKIHNTANHLARDLRSELAKDKFQLIPALESLAFAASRLEQSLQQNQGKQEIAKDAQQMLQAWEVFEKRVPRNVNEQRFQHILQVHEQLRNDIQQFRAQMS